MSKLELGGYLTGRAERYHDCIEKCVAALVACEMCADRCLEEKDIKMMVECIRLDRDCASACLAALPAMARGSAHAGHLCRVLADICDACAVECERHGGMAEHCRLCADACRRCAEACRKVAA